MNIFPILTALVFAHSSWGAWYKGNTHAHTVLSGHGDATPLEVAQWYHAHGYNFLVISEHNKFVDPEGIKLKDQREDFILVPGVEVTGPKNVHTTAFNVREVVPWKSASLVPAEILREHVQRIQALGGEAISNHPNYEWALNAQDYLAVKELKLFELYNGHPHVHVAGDRKRPSTEVIWDDVLSKGKRIFAVSSDDAHHFHKITHELSNPGRGWIMVEADSLSPDALMKSMSLGNFYASNGVVLSEVKRGPTSLDVRIDLEGTKKMIQRGRHLTGEHTRRQPGLEVEFIGLGGRVLHMERVEELSSGLVSFSSGSGPYVRAKVIYTVKTEKGAVSYYAWTQPWWR